MSNPGSEEQKLALHSALLHYGSHEFYEKPSPSRAISMTLSTNPSVNNLGTDVEVVTRLTSTLNIVSHITVNIDTSLVSDDGTPEVKLNRETILAEVLPNEGKLYTICNNYNLYVYKSGARYGVPTGNVIP